MMARNSKATQSNSRTQIVEEHIFTRSFAPLLSMKDGSARLTYAGYQHSCRKDGTNPFIKLIFSCRDITHKNPANISILSSYRISKIDSDPTKMNKITRSMLAMGFDFPETTIVTIDENDDEFGHGVADDEGFNEAIYDFLRDMRGLVWKGQLDQDDKGFYRINIESLKPLPDKKTGKQTRDYDANQAIDADDLEIDIDDTELN